jgi:hypothetical protein
MADDSPQSYCINTSHSRELRRHFEARVSPVDRSAVPLEAHMCIMAPRMTSEWNPRPPTNSEILLYIARCRMAIAPGTWDRYAFVPPVLDRAMLAVDRAITAATIPMHSCQLLDTLYGNPRRLIDGERTGAAALTATDIRARTRMFMEGVDHVEESTAARVRLARIYWMDARRNPYETSFIAAAMEASHIAKYQEAMIFVMTHVAESITLSAKNDAAARP